MAEHKKYWIKLEKDFLNSSQIKVIKNLPNGKDYIIFYLALMLESTSTEGHLRFSELVPYNEEMLASITDTNIDIVRSAMKVFQGLGMIQMLENGTLFLPEVPKRIGKECESAERVRLYRENQKALQCNANVTKSNDNKEKDKEEKKEDIKTLIDNIGYSDLRDAMQEFVVMRNKIKKPLTLRAYKMLVKKLNEITENIDEQIKILDQSILNCWQDIYPIKNDVMANKKEDVFDRIKGL